MYNSILLLLCISASWKYTEPHILSSYACSYVSDAPWHARMVLSQKVASLLFHLCHPALIHILFLFSIIVYHQKNHIGGVYIPTTMYQDVVLHPMFLSKIWPHLLFLPDLYPLLHCTRAHHPWTRSESARPLMPAPVEVQPLYVHPDMLPLHTHPTFLVDMKEVGIESLSRDVSFCSEFYFVFIPHGSVCADWGVHVWQ